MFQRTKLCKGLLIAFGGSMILGMTGVQAQESQRVEITGSAIRRIDAETALPVQVIKREQIEASGATSLVDLMQRLGSIQGATPESSSVGGSTFGFSGVSIHDVGETRTLVLLNGHRLTQFGGQTLTGFAAGFDLNAIPISAIERVEVLTDGASALYGADAIAGVVNFITKRDSTYGDVTVGYSSPADGAKEKRFSVTKGFGSMAEDGFNVILTYSHDERTALKATDRSYAKTGNIVFNRDGQTYRVQNSSPSSIPGNVLDDEGNLISPYLIANGSCPASTFRVTSGSDDYCGFDFVSTLEIYPVRKRDSFFGSAGLQVGEHQLTADLLISKTKQTSRIAPVPGSIPIAAGSDIFNTYLAPLGITQDTISTYRVGDLGPRTSDDTAKFYDLTIGAKGPFMGWDYDATLSKSRSEVKSNSIGYPGVNALANLRAQGLLNPFVGPGEQTPEAQAALDGINYRGYFDGGVSDLLALNARASRELTKLDAGPVSLAVGVNFQREKFQSKPSLFAQGLLSDPVAGTLCDPEDPSTCDVRFGDPATSIPYGADRKSYGVFGELEFPIAKPLVISTSVRYDHFSDVESATTAKASFRFTPTKELLIRGSVGTGFHAPSVPQLKASKQSYGVTEGDYACTPELQAIATSLGAECRPGSTAQYDVFAAGNDQLKPEKSKQATLGFRLEPASYVSLGADWWWVGIRDSFGQLDEADIFESPAQYAAAFTTQVDAATGRNFLALNQTNLNLGKEYRSGIDIDVTGRAKTEIGDVTSQFTATYMIKEKLQDPITGGYASALGNYNNGVTFRWQGRWQTSLKSGAWTHTAAVNFKSGYRDQLTTVEVLDASGAVTGEADLQFHIKPFYTFDWQSKWDILKNFSATVGILNLFDKNPPFVLSSGGGQQVGYDDRYYDPRGRTYYANLTYKF